ncbi:hypothetical protein B1R94_14290 [Mycolicibacterium litorale]|nr:hypothetical protein B1R94_14290 [Mycolicibacterium litorale]
MGDDLKNVRLAITLTALSALLGWAEWKTWRTSREIYPGARRAGTVGAPDTVLVLGCPWPMLHRWRVRIAIRSAEPATTRFLFSGGAVRTMRSEAQLMADYAVHTLGVPIDNVVIEDQSRSTVENVRNSLPMLAGSATIAIASNTFHAHRARRILRDQSPELAARLTRSRDYLPFEWGIAHPVLLGLEVYRSWVRR